MIEVVVVEKSDIDNKVGAYDHDRGIITIAAGWPAVHEVNTLIHEFLHAVYKDAMLDMTLLDPDNQEERTVEMMANGFTELMVRNRELMEWMLEHV